MATTSYLSKQTNNYYNDKKVVNTKSECAGSRSVGSSKTSRWDDMRRISPTKVNSTRTLNDKHVDEQAPKREKFETLNSEYEAMLTRVGT